VRPYRGLVVLAGGLVVFESLLGLAGPALTKQAIDHGIRHHNLTFLNEVALMYLGVLLASFGLGYAQYRVIQHVGQLVMRDLRHDLFAHLQRLPIAYFDRNPIGRLMTRVTHDVDVLNELVSAVVGALFGDLVTVLGICFAMSTLNVELLAVTFSVLPLIAIVTLLFRSRIRRSFREVRTRLARMNAFLNENLSGMNTVQMLTREHRNFGAFREVNASHRDAHLDSVYYHALFFPIMELVGALAVSLIIWYGGRQVMWTGITLGTLVAFIQYTQRFFRPISDLSEKYGTLQQAMASLERIFRLLDTPVDPAAAPALSANGAAAARPITQERAHAPLAGRVEFDHVWFAYQGEHWVLEDVTFTLEPGEKLALVGATGSGKTTIAHLLLRFYVPQRGEIRVDGRPLADWDPWELRAQIGLVLQDVFLFSGTIATNLRLGADGPVRADVERAAREVSAHEFIERLPGGFDAVVRERGATLSAGQRQLLSFARTLAREPRLLVLDEATSSVDVATEVQIQEALRRLMAGRTSLVIAHRLSTIQDADRIVVIHHGRVREVGTHAELMAIGGLYSRLYQLQVLGGRAVRAAPTPAEWRADETTAAGVVDKGFGLS
jgi:ABC-type multidrug transport system fused ATPase/permease subunit